MRLKIYSLSSKYINSVFIWCYFEWELMELFLEIKNDKGQYKP